MPGDGGVARFFCVGFADDRIDQTRGPLTAHAPVDHGQTEVEGTLPPQPFVHPPIQPAPAQGGIARAPPLAPAPGHHPAAVGDERTDAGGVMVRGAVDPAGQQ